MSQKLREWWSGGGFFQIMTMLVLAGITWGTTTATIRSDQASSRERLDDRFASLSQQLSEVKGQISAVRAAQDEVLRLRSELSALRDRIASLETDYKTQIQINARLMADVARLER